MICEKHNCKMSERACILRQALARKKAHHGVAPSQYAFCLECEQGKAIAQKMKEQGEMPKIYTEAEKRFLTNNIDKMSSRELAEKLGRSEKGLVQALARFGLKRKLKSDCAAPDHEQPASLTIDFSNHPGVLQKLSAAAKQELRSTEMQALYILKCAVEQKRASDDG